MQLGRGPFGAAGSILAVGGAVVALVYALAPVLLLDYERPDDPVRAEVGDVLSLADLFRFHDDAGMTAWTSPVLTLAGAVAMAMGGLGLLVLSQPRYSPLQVTRGGAAFVATSVMGACLVAVPNLLWVGSGFGLGPGHPAADTGGITGGLTGLVQSVLGTDSAAGVTVVQPLLAAAVAIVCILVGLRLAGDLAGTVDSSRALGDHVQGARWALVFLVLVLVLPWSAGMAPDGLRQGDNDMFLHGAHTILNDHAAQGTWDGMSLALHVFIWTALAGIGLGLAGASSNFLGSARSPVAWVFRHTPWVMMAGIALCAVLYVLAWAFWWKPTPGAPDHSPGYATAVLVVVLAFWFASKVQRVRNPPRAGNPGQRQEPA